MIDPAQRATLRRRTATLRAAAFALFGIASAMLSPDPAVAELIDRGGGLIYDTELDVTWLQDARYSAATGFDHDGRMIWPRAASWIAELEYYDAVRDHTWTDWRLPDAQDFDSAGWPCFGFSCPKGELGHLYFEHGIDSLSPAPFINVVNGAYWYGDMRAPQPGLAWVFQFQSGKQDHTGPFEELQLGYTWPVRDGDVADVPAPVPLGGLGPGILAGLLAVLLASGVIRARATRLTR